MEYIICPKCKDVSKGSGWTAISEIYYCKTISYFDPDTLEYETYLGVRIETHTIGFRHECGYVVKNLEDLK